MWPNMELVLTKRKFWCVMWAGAVCLKPLTPATKSGLRNIKHYKAYLPQTNTPRLAVLRRMPTSPLKPSFEAFIRG